MKFWKQYAVLAAISLTTAFAECEALTLTLSGMSSAYEDSGWWKRAGIIDLGQPAEVDVTVAVTCDRPDLVELYDTDDSYDTAQTIVIPQGSTRAYFDVRMLDNSAVDNPAVRLVTISASIPGLGPATTIIEIKDDDASAFSADVFYQLTGGIDESAGLKSYGGLITLPVAPAESVDVLLESDDPSELTVPAQMTIPAGQNYLYIPVTVVDDALTDGAQRPRVKVTIGAEQASIGFIIRDNEPHHLLVDAIDSPKISGEEFFVEVSMATIDDYALQEGVIGTLTAVARGEGTTEYPVTVKKSQYHYDEYDWSGDVAILGAGNPLRLIVRNASGLSGTSNPFRVDVGPLAKFGFSPIASPKGSSSPFNVTITAQDKSGLTIPDFNGVVSLSGRTGGRPTEVGDTKYTFYYPFYTSPKKARTEIILHQNELGPAGTFNKLALHVETAGSAPLTKWTIRIKPTTKAEFDYDSPWETGGWTTVFQGNVTVSGPGWVEFPFTTAYPYNGQGNLMIDLSFNNTTFYPSLSCYAGSADGSRMFVASGTTDPLTWAGSFPYGGAYSLLPHMRLSGGSSVVVTPGQSGSFVSGVWSGDLAVQGYGPDVVLRAASTSGMDGYSDPFEVSDLSALNIELPATISEGVGSLDNVARVVLAQPASSAVSVSLVASDTTKLQVPSSIVIPAGASEAFFAVTALDDAVVDGPQAVSITAAASGYLPDSSNLVITDDEVLAMTLTTSAESAFEGISGLTASLVISPAAAMDISIPITSSDNGEITTSGSFFIPKGITSADATFATIQDGDTDGAQVVTLSASYPGSANATKTFVVKDATLDHIDMGTIATPQYKAVPFALQLTAKNIDGETIPNFAGAATLGAYGVADSIDVSPSSTGNFQQGIRNVSISLNAQDESVIVYATAWGAVVGESNPFALQIPGQKVLTIVSAHGAPQPPIGANPVGEGTIVACSVQSPITAGSTQRVCVGWQGTGDVPASGNANSVSVTISNDSSLAWLWTTNVTLKVGNAESWRALGSDVAVTPSVPNGYHFTHWSGDLGAIIEGGGASLSITVRMSSAVTLTPHFERDPFRLTVVSPYGSPQPPVGSLLNESGDGLSPSMATPFIENAGTQYTCTGWTMTGNIPLSGSESSFTMQHTNDATLTWNWTRAFAFARTASPGGTVSGAAEGWFQEGSTVTLQATPDQGSAFVSWTGDVPASQTKQNPLTLTMNRKRSVTAQFEPPPAAPAVSPVTTPTVLNRQTLTGTKAAKTDVRRGGLQLVPWSESTTWSAEVALAEGNNEILLHSTIPTGLSSSTTIVSIVYQNVPPAPVTVTGSGVGSGVQASLDWSAYDEAAQGDVDHYDVYQAQNPFTSKDNAVKIGSRPAGEKSLPPTSLTRGATYYFAVVAVDEDGLESAIASSIAVTTSDIQPPQNPTAPVVASFADKLTVGWSAPADTDDLSGYRVYVNGSATGEATVTAMYSANSLPPGTKNSLRIAARDTSGNESSGLLVDGYTLIPAVTGLSAEPGHQSVNLSWAPVSQASVLKHYAIYRSLSPITSVAGLQPVGTTALSSYKATGLQNQTPYHFAVVAVNLGGAGDVNVASVQATPSADLLPPTIASVRYGSVELVDGSTLSRTADVTVNATDPSGVARVDFALDGVQVFSDKRANASPHKMTLRLEDIADGAHIIELRATDTYGNTSLVSRAFTLALAAPTVVPTLTNPMNGDLASELLQRVQGVAPSLDYVVIQRNEVPLTDYMIRAGSNGIYAGYIPLVEGTNRLRAAVWNRSGTGPFSSESRVTLDTSVPAAPVQLTAKSREGGEVLLSWQRGEAGSVKGYNVYRAASAFSSTSAAQRVNTSLLAGITRVDLPPQDGTYHYAVATVNAAGTEGPLSSVASAASDRALPRAEIITLQPMGKYDPATGRFGRGKIAVQLRVSEPLLTVPFLSLAPAGGVPIMVALTHVQDREYAATIDLGANTVSGPAVFNFSSRDLVGNRGTAIDAGANVLLDTTGPEITNLVVQPHAPIANDAASPSVVLVTAFLSEPVKPGSLPKLAYTLSGHTGVTNTLPPLAAINDTTWSGSFQLPADAGAAQEFIRFSFSAKDDLDNDSSRIRADNNVEVYQGTLPALGSPFGLVARARPAGRIELSWDVIEGADDYQIFRRSPGQTSLVPLERSGGETTYLDQPLTEGIYEYAVASIRAANGAERVGAMSPIAHAQSDRTAPASPSGLQLVLAGNGIQMNWQPPAFTEPVSYSLYKSSAASIPSTQGLTAFARDVVVTSVVDPKPSKSEHAYTVTAVDIAGNESMPAPSQYLNFSLLPVGSISVTLTNGELPLLSWSHPYPADIGGYNVYLNGRAAGLRLNASTLHTTTFKDAGFGAGERLYSVIGIDQQGVESPERLIRLPNLTTTLSTTNPIKRGMMNRLTFEIVNASTVDVKNVRVRAGLGGQTNASAKINVASGATGSVFVVLGGATNLPEQAVVRVVTEVAPNEGELVSLVQESLRPAVDDVVVAGIVNSNITRGTFNAFRWTLLNTGTEPIDIVTARQNGKADSPDVRFTLLDEDFNVYHVAAARQALGSNVLTLVNGDSIARVEPGAMYVSDAVDLFVPTNAPEQAIVQLEIDRIYYHRALPDESRVNGVRYRSDIVLIDTPYFAEVTNVTPDISQGLAPVRITGRSVHRASGQALGDADIQLHIQVNGFERVVDLKTSATGDFSYDFLPLAGESGQYATWASHPALKNKYAQKTFTISRIAVEPTGAVLKTPVSYTQVVAVAVTPSAGTTVHNLRFAYEAADQVAGVSVDTGAVIPVLGPQERGAIQLRIAGQSVTNGTLKLRLRSDESGPDGWAPFTVTYQFAEAKPAVAVLPAYIDTGVGLGQIRSEQMTIENRGYDTLRDVQLFVVDAQGNPAPTWVALTVSAQQGDIQPGEKRDIGLSFSPPAGTAQARYEFKLVILSSNHAEVRYNVYAAVTTTDRGAVQFKVTDMNSFSTLDANGQLITGVKDARIQLQNELVLSVETSVVTDAAGEVLVPNLPAGWYRVVITGKKHYPYQDRIVIKPGVTSSELVGLENQLVIVQWKVVPTTIQDSYQIVLNATFETDVRAAILSLEPGSVPLPPGMKAGDVMNGQLKLMNRGLIRADQVTFSPPKSDANFKYEILGQVPDTLDPQEFVLIPYRITCLKPVGQDGSSGSGGGCSTYQNCASAACKFKCANGKEYGNGTSTCFTEIRCTESVAGSSTPSPVYSAGGGVGGSGGKGPVYVSLQGGETCPDCPKCDVDGDGDGDTCPPCMDPITKAQFCPSCDSDGDGTAETCPFEIVEFVDDVVSKDMGSYSTYNAASNLKNEVPHIKWRIEPLEEVKYGDPPTIDQSGVVTMGSHPVEVLIEAVNCLGFDTMTLKTCIACKDRAGFGKLTAEVKPLDFGGPSEKMLARVVAVLSKIPQIQIKKVETKFAGTGLVTSECCDKGYECLEEVDKVKGKAEGKLTIDAEVHTLGKPITVTKEVFGHTVEVEKRIGPMIGIVVAGGLTGAYEGQDGIGCQKHCLKVDLAGGLTVNGWIGGKVNAKIKDGAVFTQEISAEISGSVTGGGELKPMACTFGDCAPNGSASCSSPGICLKDVKAEYKASIKLKLKLFPDFTYEDNGEMTLIKELCVGLEGVNK